MPNMLMLHYAAKHGDERMDNMLQNRDMRMEPDRREDYNRPGTAYGREDPGMRQTNEYEGAESRYRGKDGRWHSGTRRSMGDGGGAESRYSEPRNSYMGGEDDEDEHGRKYKIEVMPSNVIPFHEPRENYRTSRHIGFGAQGNMDHSDSKKDDHMLGKSGYQEAEMEFDRHTAENWVRSMQNEDKSHPVGGKWSPDQLKPLAQKYGIPTDGKKFWEFYAMTNAMYSDYGEVARKFGITSPEFYVCMAKAWMDDKDAEPDKTALYYEYIVKKNDRSPMAA